MSLSICADCLSKLRIPSKIVASTVSLATTTASTSSFHSSATQYANPLKKKSGTQTPLKFRESRSAKIKRKGKERPKPPAVGERRAARRRIVLSNTNALEVQGMEDLSVKNMCDAEKVGQMLGLEGPLLDQLRDAKAFKRTQNWHMFRKPATLMRGDTVHLGQDIKEVNGSQHDQGLGAPFIRRLITGERASGKSVMLLQAMCMAFLSKWVVIHVPEGEFSDLTTSDLLTMGRTRLHPQPVVVCAVGTPRRLPRGTAVHPTPSHSRPPLAHGPRE